ncbi:serine hydrolase domain-containing protein [Plantactinospora sp. B24E8]|uniref:serine hydrolase domain-containing protein n=1 Tax=Plantactinospora sp. B24E8 TaxID=3153567 RepID=UPI00325F4A09
MTVQQRRPPAHRWLGAAATLAILGAVAVAVTPTTATATARTPLPTPAQGQAPAGSHRDAVQRSLDELVRADGFPAVLASVRGRDGRVRHYTAGVADLRTRAKVPTDGYVRIGSNTKTYLAVVVLQLVGEGRIELDESVETYLPGLVRGDGVDGRRITVRQLLQHTSGLPNYTALLPETYETIRHRYVQPRELLDLGLSQKATDEPGETFSYSNTGYVVAGLLVEKVTGRPVREEITNRIIRPLGLRHTYFPNVGDQEVRRPHPKGYHQDRPEQPLTDVTVMDPSMGWAAGQMVATPSDLNRFFVALLDGDLLAPEQLRQMRDTVDAPGPLPNSRYGLGLQSTPMSCGGLSWGHGGNIFGYSTVNAATDDGRAVTIAATRLPTDLAEVEHLLAALDTALCG